MIVGYLNNEQETKYFNEKIKKVLTLIKKTNYTKMEDGRYDIDGDRLYALVQTYTTTPKDEKKMEAHRKYIDIQVILDGIEVIGYAQMKENKKLNTPYDEKNDFVLYDDVDNETDLILSSGMYAVFFPWDLHKPGCTYKKESTVKKLVVKVKI